MNRTVGPTILCGVDFMAFSTVPLTPTRKEGHRKIVRAALGITRRRFTSSSSQEVPWSVL